MFVYFAALRRKQPHKLFWSSLLKSTKAFTPAEPDNYTGLFLSVKLIFTNLPNYPNLQKGLLRWKADHYRPSVLFVNAFLLVSNKAIELCQTNRLSSMDSLSRSSEYRNRKIALAKPKVRAGVWIGRSFCYAIKAFFMIIFTAL